MSRPLPGVAWPTDDKAKSDAKEFGSVQRAAHTVGLADTDSTGRLDTVTASLDSTHNVRFLLQRSATEARRQRAASVQYATFEKIGTSKLTLPLRVLLVWLVVFPVLALKTLLLMAVSVFVTVFVTGGIWTALLVAPPVGAVVMQPVYRDSLLWAQDNYEFQTVWDWAAFLLSLTMNILLYTYRLMNEVWNGFCPFLALFADLIFEITRQLIAIWFSVPILQYMVFWLIRLVVFLTPTWLDGLVQILEAYTDLATALSQELTAELQQEAEAQFGRRILSGEEFYVPTGEMLLQAAVIVLTLVSRALVALLVAYLPLWYSFVRLVLPMILKYLPPILEVIIKIFSIFTSEPVRRIVQYLLSSLPIVLELLQAFICGFVTVLGSSFCYIVYGLVVMLGFILRYIIRPAVCGTNAFLAGCFKAFVYSAIQGQDCYKCGDYHTACGCAKNVAPVDASNCDATCTVGGQPAPPTPPPDDLLLVFVTDEDGLSDMTIPRNSGPEDNPDIGVSSISADMTTHGQTYEECDIAVTPNCEGPDVVTTSSLSDTTGLRRRRTIGTNTGTPPTTSPTSGNATQNPTAAPTQYPTTAPTANTRRRVVAQTVPGSAATVVVSVAAVFTSSPGLYEELLLQFEGEVGVIRLGTLPYRGASGIKCLPGTACDAAAAVAALSGRLGSTPFVLGTTSHEWWFAEWTPAVWLRVDLATPARVHRVEVSWVNVGTHLYAPAVYDVAFHQSRLTTTGGEVAAQIVRHVASCVVGATTVRIDTVAASPAVNLTTAVTISANVSSACDALPEPRQGYRLRGVVVWGSRDGVAPHHLRQEAGVNAHVSFRSTETTMWDPCASGRPQRMADGKREYPSVFWANDGATAPSAGFQLRLHDTNGPANVSLSAAVVHLSPTSVVAPSSVRMCTGDVASWDVAMASTNCVAAVDNRPPTTGFGWNGAMSLYRTYGNYTSGPFASAPFWDTTATAANVTGAVNYIETSFPERGQSLRFVFNGSHSNESALTLWFGPVALLSAPRETNWETARLELGMHTGHHVEAQWLTTVTDALYPNGNTSDPALVDTVYCPDALDATVEGFTEPPLQGVAAYTAPFGASTATKRWLGVTEIDLIGVKIAAAAGGGGRRLLSEQKVVGVKEQQLLDRLSARTQKMRRTPTDETYSVSATMSVRGLAHIQSGSARPLASAEAFRLHEHATNAAPDNAQEQPFHSDLRQLPDSSREPKFRCYEYRLPGNATALMRCAVMSPAVLPTPPDAAPPPNDTEGTAAQNGQMTWSTMVELQSPELAERLRHAHTAVELRTALRTVRLSSLQVPHTSAGRELLAWWDDANPASEVWDQVKNKVASAITAALAAMEAQVCDIMMCGVYCHSWEGCNHQKIGECIPKLLEYTVHKIFQCDDDDSLFDCTIGRLKDWVMSMLEAVLDWLLTIVDYVGEAVGLILHLGDLLKIIACQACAVTTIATGVLADFLDDFPTSRCQDIMDEGTSQCDKWGMGDPLEAGAAIFANFMPMLKILFGLAATTPALGEVLVEVAIVIFSNALEIFPELLGDGYSIILWFISSSGVIGTVETLFEAFIPIVEEAASSFGDISASALAETTDEAAWQDNDDPEGLGVVYVEDSVGAGECFESDVDVGAACDRTPWGATAADRNAVVANLTAGRGAFDVSKEGGGTMELKMGGCGCVMTRQSCEDGAGAGNCIFKDGPASVRRAQVRASSAAQAANQTAGGEDDWPLCADVHGRSVQPNTEGVFRGSSPEMKRMPVASKQCVVLVRAPKRGHINKMAKETAFRKASNVIDADAWFPFKRTSKQDGGLTYDTDHDIDQPEVPSSAVNKPSLGDVFRRRSPGRRILMDRVKMGVSDMYSDASVEEKLEAMSAMRRLLLDANTSYASEQIDAIRADVSTLSSWIRVRAQNWTSPSTQGVEGMARHISHRARHLLGLGFSGVEAADLACGFTAADGASANTYPCAKHLWCAIPPVIPRDFRFEKRWVAWRSNWVDNTKCPELLTVSDAVVFAVRAFCKTVRSYVDTSQSIWPWDTVIDGVWSFTTFPGDQWPQHEFHGDDHLPFTLTCIFMNIGSYIAIVVGVYVGICMWPAVAVACTATFVICEQTFRRTDLQEVELSRRERERGEAKLRTSTGILL